MQRCGATGEKLEWDSQGNPQYSSMVKSLLKQMTQNSAEKRINWEDLYNHELLKNFAVQLELENEVLNGRIYLVDFPMTYCQWWNHRESIRNSRTRKNLDKLPVQLLLDFMDGYPPGVVADREVWMKNEKTGQKFNCNLLKKKITDYNRLLEI